MIQNTRWSFIKNQS